MEIQGACNKSRPTGNGVPCRNSSLERTITLRVNGLRGKDGLLVSGIGFSGCRCLLGDCLQRVTIVRNFEIVFSGKTPKKCVGYSHL